MEKTRYNIVKNSLLFKGINPHDIPRVLSGADAREVTFSAGEYLFSQQSSATTIGLVLSGCAQVEREDFDGSQIIISKVEAGDLFAETLACGEGPYLPIYVKALKKCHILMLDYEKIKNGNQALLFCQGQLMANLMLALAQRNFALANNIGYLSRRSTRNKILTYLTDQAMIAESATFFIPFNRQEMADFLCVDRCALSTELSRLQAENILRFRKNHFVLQKLPQKVSV